MSHWAEQYIGKPWVSGARGPDEFDCWGLVWWVYKQHYGLQLPLFPGFNDVPATPLQVSGIIGETLRDPELPWDRVLVPTCGCAVAMGIGKRFHHVGVWLDLDGGLILHAARKRNVVAQSLSAVQHLGMSNIAFFQHHGAHHRDLQPV